MIDRDHPNKTDADKVPNHSEQYRKHCLCGCSWLRTLKCFLGFHHMLFNMERCEPAAADMMVGEQYFKYTGNGKCLYCPYQRSGISKLEKFKKGKHSLF